MNWRRADFRYRIAYVRHPNVKTEQRRLTKAAYKDFVYPQLSYSKAVLEQKLGKRIDLLAWPFGIYDDWLMKEATLAGYQAAFTLDRRSVQASDRPMAFPRFLMTDSQQGKAFERFLAEVTGGTV